MKRAEEASVVPCECCGCVTDACQCDCCCSPFRRAVRNFAAAVSRYVTRAV